jgi:hypothetical protein
MMRKEPATKRKTHSNRQLVKDNKRLLTPTARDEFASRSKKGRPGWNFCRVMGKY